MAIEPYRYLAQGTERLLQAVGGAQEKILSDKEMEKKEKEKRQYEKEILAERDRMKFSADEADREFRRQQSDESLAQQRVQYADTQKYREGKDKEDAEFRSKQLARQQADSDRLAQATGFAQQEKEAEALRKSQKEARDLLDKKLAAGEEVPPREFVDAGVAANDLDAVSMASYERTIKALAAQEAEKGKRGVAPLDATQKAQRLDELENMPPDKLTPAMALERDKLRYDLTPGTRGGSGNTNRSSGPSPTQATPPQSDNLAKLESEISALSQPTVLPPDEMNKRKRQLDELMAQRNKIISPSGAVERAYVEWRLSGKGKPSDVDLRALDNSGRVAALEIYVNEQSNVSRETSSTAKTRSGLKVVTAKPGL